MLLLPDGIFLHNKKATKTKGCDGVGKCQLCEMGIPRKVMVPVWVEGENKVMWHEFTEAQAKRLGLIKGE